ncbi:hypothetical protein ROBYS_44800 [Roseobacter sp. OBYS 0001]|nr:hypothetical protein ROBYS_44800 [Roseobacter sp. OBYS 0001]
MARKSALSVGKLSNLGAKELAQMILAEADQNAGSAENFCCDSRACSDGSEISDCPPDMIESHCGGGPNRIFFTVQSI